jgi:hypothetical protein
MAGRTYLKNIQDEFTKDMVRALSSLGYEAMNDAYAKRAFVNRTGNLHDSYACAVFVDGKIVQSTLRYLDNPMSTKRDAKTNKTGHETAKDYMNSHSFGAKNHEVVLVVIAAMYYAGILEKKYYFEVISPARSYIDTHWDETLAPVYAKYGIKQKPRARVIQGERL